MAQRWSERTRFEVGDEVSDGTDVGVVELSYPRRGDGKQWPIVHIRSGARNGQRQWPSAGGWRPVLDHDGDRVFKLRCDGCDRPFWAPARFPECRTCSRKSAAEEARRERSLHGSATFARLGAAPAFTPAPVVANATEEQRARIERGRVSHDGDVPF